MLLGVKIIVYVVWFEHRYRTIFIYCVSPESFIYFSAKLHDIWANMCVVNKPQSIGVRLNSRVMTYNTFRPLVTSLCLRPQRLFEDFNKVTLIALCLIESAWITPCPALYYKHSSFDFNSSFHYFFFTLLLLNYHFPHCLWLVDLSFWQTNKQGAKWRSSQWMCDYG